MSWWGEILTQLIGSRVEASIAIVKIQAAIAYLNFIKGARRLTLLFCLLVGCIVVLACGFLLIPVALCLFMPWTGQTKAIVAASTGAAYIIIPLIVILVLFSERHWMKVSRADKLLKEALKR